MENKIQIVKLGKNFKEIRVSLGFSLKQMADFLKLDEEIISCFENGKRTIGVADLEKACELFGCDLQTLKSEENYKPILCIPQPQKISVEDMESICKVQRIALALRKIKNY